MDSHPKKKTSTEQIKNQSTVTSLAEKTKYSLYKENQTPDPEQTKPTVRQSRRSQVQLAPSLVVLV